MKMVMDPQYAHLSQSLMPIVEGGAAADAVYKDGRNKVYRISCQGMQLVVKEFKVPNAFNRVVYSFLRPSKAKRSFVHAKRLKALGIDTAEPVAYVETFRRGVFHTGYFISEFVGYELLGNIGELDTATRSEIIRQFCRFTADMHSKKVLHKDFNPGNVFYHKEDGHYRFALIDINRMAFRAPKKKEVIRSFTQLGFPQPIIVEIIGEYARIRGWNPDIVSGAVLLRRGMDLRGKAKRGLKRFVQPLKTLRREIRHAL